MTAPSVSSREKKDGEAIKHDGFPVFYFTQKELSREQQLTVLRHRPEVIVDHQFKVIDVGADLLHRRAYHTVVHHGCLMLALRRVGGVALLRHALHQLLDGGDMAGDLIY